MWSQSIITDWSWSKPDRGKPCCKYHVVVCRMPSKKAAAGGAVSGPKSRQQPPSTSPKKKCVAVDQYMARTLLHEIPSRVPRKGEIVPRPDTLPSLVQQTARNELHCEVCHAVCTSFTTLKQHQAGKSHRKHVLIRAIQLNRYFKVCGM